MTFLAYLKRRTHSSKRTRHSFYTTGIIISGRGTMKLSYGFWRSLTATVSFSHYLLFLAWKIASINVMKMICGWYATLCIIYVHINCVYIINSCSSSYPRMLIMSLTNTRLIMGNLMESREIKKKNLNYVKPSNNIFAKI